MKKRIFAMFLSLTMIMAMFPATAFAADDVVWTEVSTVDEMTAALTGEAINQEVYIKLMNDITATGARAVSLNKDQSATTVTLDLNGHNITSDNGNYTIHVGKECELTIIGEGTINNTNSTSTTIRNYGTLTIGEENGSAFPTVECLDKTSIANSAVKCEEGTTMTIWGGTFNGHHRAIQSWGNVTIHGGEFTGYVDSWEYKDHTGDDPSDYPACLTINDGTFNWAVRSCLDNDPNNFEPGDIVVNGGTLLGATKDGEVTRGLWYDIVEPANPVAEETAFITITGGTISGKLTPVDNATFAITGGTFDNDVTNYVSENFRTVRINENSTACVVRANNAVSTAVNYTYKYLLPRYLQLDGATEFNWYTMINAAYYYEEALKYLDDLNGDEKISEAEFFARATEGFEQITEVDMSGKTETGFTEGDEPTAVQAAPLRFFTKMKILNLSNIPSITEADYDALKDMAELEELYLNGTGVTTFGSLTALGAGVSDTLKVLDLSDTNVTKLEDFWIDGDASFPNLETLNAKNLELTSISGLAELVKNEKVDLANTNLKWDLSGSSLETSNANSENYATINTAFAADGVEASWAAPAYTKADGSVTAPTAKEGLKANGQAQELINAGSSETGTIQYKLGTDVEYSTEIPTATDAGEYTVYYKVIGDIYHNDVAEASITVTIAKNDDATLKTLTVTDATLDKEFAADTTEYSATVPYTVESVTIEAHANDEKATVVINGNDTLVVGNNTFTIVVTAEDGTTTKTYTVVVKREAKPLSNVATLQALTVTGATLDKEFDADTTEYYATVSYDVDSVTIVATATDDNATVDIKGEDALEVGENIFEIEVTAEDGTTKQVYTITVTRKEAPTPEHTCTWGETTYTWTENGKSCTAERVCSNDSTHKETATAAITSAVKTPATCTAKGTTTYTATFEKDWADVQTKDVADIAIDTDAHSYGTEWVKNDETTHKRVCANNAEHVETAAHVYDNDADTTCNTCDYVRVVVIPSEPSYPSTPSTPGTGSTTTTNPDGSSTTTQVDKVTGTVTETTRKPDGSTETVKTEANGTVTTSVATADGSKSETTVVNGIQTSDVAVSNQAVREATTAGKAVALPVPATTATKNSASAPTVTVDLPYGVNNAKVEVPVANVSAGTVAVIVHADGTEEVVRNCVPTEDGIALTVKDGATVKIVDNSRDFGDVAENHTFNDAIDFASARGIIEGYGATFAPANLATSNAVVTVVSRIMGNDFYGSTAVANANSWAKENGITAGLDMSGNITRGSFMTMLWRAAGCPAASTVSNFADASNLNDVEMAAIAWAVEQGLIGGYADGTVRPGAGITRGAMAAIAQRYMTAN